MLAIVQRGDLLSAPSRPKCRTVRAPRAVSSTCQVGYPADLGHNFVLAHAACNHAKSDYLAAEDHLAVWSERNRLTQDELVARLQQAALPCDLSASVQIAEWAYEQTEKANGQVWVVERTLRHLGPTWRQCLSL